ncbi:rhodanese-like domain-containing protein [Crocinitomicaceae bacterium]|nr:rhodanese-like domain-containing protein [Crocinitomicaceae bacterium]MDC0257884.1 rhodanese-like domain-containing protein [Crocinitomicaceae bacterium]
MKQLIIAAIALLAFSSQAQEGTIYPDESYVDFDRFLALANEVRDHREERMISMQEFNEMTSEKNTIILDTRSKAMYDAKHIKGAIHLCFSDFTQLNLARIIPDTNTRILIYCNNNILDDELFFPTKSLSPIEMEEIRLRSLPNGPKEFPLTMALNVPTYINLYGYGYKNVYELADLVSTRSSEIEFEGSEIIVDESRN